MLQSQAYQEWMRSLSPYPQYIFLNLSFFIILSPLLLSYSFFCLMGFTDAEATILSIPFGLFPLIVLLFVVVSKSSSSRGDYVTRYLPFIVACFRLTYIRRGSDWERITHFRGINLYSWVTLFSIFLVNFMLIIIPPCLVRFFFVE